MSLLTALCESHTHCSRSFGENSAWQTHAQKDPPLCLPLWADLHLLTLESNLALTARALSASGTPVGPCTLNAEVFGVQSLRRTLRDGFALSASISRHAPTGSLSCVLLTWNLLGPNLRFQSAPRTTSHSTRPGPFGFFLYKKPTPGFAINEFHRLPNLGASLLFPTADKVTMLNRSRFYGDFFGPVTLPSSGAHGPLRPWLS